MTLNIKSKLEFYKSYQYSQFFFNIYIWNIFKNKKIVTKYHIFFIDSFYFFIVKNSIFEIKKILEKITKIALNWKISNIIIYNISKTNNILFFKI